MALRSRKHPLHRTRARAARTRANDAANRQGRTLTNALPPRREAADPVDHGDLEQKILGGSGWLGLSYGGGAVLWLLAVLVLARLLTPADFGLVAIATAVLVFLEAVQTGGMHTALIQRRTDLKEAVASTFLFSALLGFALYGLLFAAAPLMASFFNAPRLDEVTRVIGLAVIMSGLTRVPGALLHRELAFRNVAMIEIAAVVSQCVVSVAAALVGFGVWSLVAGQVVRALVGCALAWALTPMRPELAYRSWPVLRELIHFARFVSAARFTELTLTSVDNLIVGRLLGAGSLGFYAIAFRLATVPSSLLAVVGNVVMLPALSLVQHDPVGFRKAFVANLERLALVALPFSAILVVGADPIVNALLGSNWDAAVEPVRWLAVYSLVRALTMTVIPAFEAVGRPGLPLALIVPHAVTLIPLVYVLTSWRGTTGAAIGMFLSLLTTAIPTVIVGSRVLNLRGRELAAAIAGPAVSCALLCVALLVLLYELDGFDPHFVAATLTLAGGAVYLAAASVFARGILLPIVTSIRTRGRGRIAPSPQR